MVRSLKYLIFSVFIMIQSTLFCAQLPIGMQPAGALAVTQSGLVNYTAKPNVKTVSANNPDIEASITDLSDAMKTSLRSIFDAYGLIPMLVNVKNNSDAIIHVAPEGLDFGLGLSLDGVKDVIIKKFNLKKYGIYASIMTYRAIILVSLITAGIYFPYAEVCSLSSGLLASVTPPAGAIYSAGTSGLSMLSQIPGFAKFGAGVISLSLGLKYLTPSIFVKPFHAVIDSYYGMRATCRVPYIQINELNQAIDFVVSSSNNRDLGVNSKSSKQLIIFVRSTDATAIKNGTSFPALKYKTLERQ